MSDTQGAPDQSVDDATDTATGGLQNDMPGLPMQPPSGGGGRPPSPLSGIAMAVQRMMGGAPAPQAAQPGRSPYAFPGVSQIPPSMGGARPPQGRWTGTTASLALPKGSLQPRAMFTPFMSSAPTDSHKQWGEDELFPDLPQSHEVPGIYNNLAQFFAKTGSQSMIPLAMSLHLNVGQFLEGMMKGQEWQAKMARAKMQDDAYKLAQQQAEMLHRYSDTIDEFAAGAGVSDPSKIGKFTIGGQTLLDKLGQDAIELGDKNMEALAGLGNVDAMIKYNHDRNDNLRNLTKANAATEKQDAQDREESATWGQNFGGGAAGGGAARNPAEVMPSEYGGGGGAQPSAIPGGAPAPRMQLPADQNQGEQQSPAPTAAPANTPWANDAPAVQQAERLAATGRGIKVSDPRAQDYINKQAMEMQNWVQDNIVRNKNIGPDVLDKDGNVISSPVEDALDKYLGGSFSSDSKGIAYYSEGLGGGQTGGGGGGGPEQNYNRVLEALAMKRRPGDLSKGIPGWQQRNYQLITDFDKNNQVAQTVGRFTNLATTGQQLKEAVDNLPDDLKGNAFTVAMKNIQEGKFSGDERFVAVANAWNNYNIEKNVLLRGGVGGVGETERSQQVIPPLFARPEDFRLALVQDAQNTMQRGVQIVKRYHDLGGQGDPPGWDRGAFEATRGLANIEPVNGKEPGDRVMIDGVPAIWNGYYDEQGRLIPKNKRYTQVNP